MLKELANQRSRRGLGHLDWGWLPPLSCRHPVRLEGLLLGLLGQLGGLEAGEVAQRLDDGRRDQVDAVVVVGRSFEA